MSRPVVVHRRTALTHPAPTPLPTPCVLWQGAANGGYGTRLTGERKSYLHRWVWEQVHGPIPEGMVVMHRCDNPPCFRYDHLRLGTHADNVADRIAKGRPHGRGNRPRRETCRFGHPIIERNGHRWCETCKQANADRHRKRKAK